MKMNTNIYQELEITLHSLLNHLSGLDQKQLNLKPFEGSWSAGQVGEHLLLSYKLISIFNGRLEGTERIVDDKKDAIKDMFLNMNVKFKTDKFIEPRSSEIEKDKLLAGLNKSCKELLDFASTKDLSLTCMDFELPTFGTLTILEWLYFIAYHTQRHTIQLQNIISKIKR